MSAKEAVDKRAGTVWVAVLAAGASRRFGTHKLLTRWRGKPLLLHALECAQQACPGRVMLVTGHEADGIEAAASADADLFVFNRDYALGLGTSIAAAARACPADTDAIVIALGDQPLVTLAHYQALISAWDGARSGIVASAFAETLGPPVLFGRQYLPELEELGDDSGAKRILSEHREQVVTVNFPPAAVDIDTPEDFAALDQASSSEQTYA